MRDAGHEPLNLPSWPMRHPILEVSADTIERLSR
jgi:hypothetical protein